MFELGSIFNQDQYDAAFEYIMENKLAIREIEPENGERRFEIWDGKLSAEILAEQKRSERNGYLETYVDPVVSNPLRWEGLTDDEKNQLKAYRQYLLDIPQDEAFPEVKILTFDEWKE